MTSNRLIAIGDIHGEIQKLNSLLKKLCLTKSDTVVFLGDYIDRGYYSKEVINKLIEISDFCHCEFLMGNHEKMLLNYYKSHSENDYCTWMFNGGEQTLDSYGSVENVFQKHNSFFEQLKYYYLTYKYLFVHAGIRPDKTLKEQEKEDFIYIRDNFINYKHKLPQKVIFGHTPFEKPLIEDDKIGIDTGCGKYDNAPLTAIICDEERFLFSD